MVANRPWAVVLLCYLSHICCTAVQGSNAKLGTGWEVASVKELAAVPGITWYYNWGMTQASDSIASAASDHGIEFVPMQWGQWGIEGILDVPSLEHATHLLGFNEPNNEAQANLAPEFAAQLWSEYMQPVWEKYGSDLKIGAPAAATCGVDCTDGIASPFIWWEEFFGNCSGCHFDFLPVHLYTCSVVNFKKFIHDANVEFNLPIWVTEFSCPVGNGEHTQEVLNYMAEVLPWMDGNPHIERYGWYSLVNEGSWLGTPGSLVVANAQGVETTNAEGQLTLTPVGQYYLGSHSESGTTIKAEDLAAQLDYVDLPSDGPAPGPAPLEVATAAPAPATAAPAAAPNAIPPISRHRVDG